MEKYFICLGAGKEAPDMRYFMRVGIDGDYQIVSKRVGALDRLPEILTLAPLRVWQERFPKRNAEGVVTGVDMGSASAWLIEESRSGKAGIFDEARIRGRGVWNDEGRYVVHIGEELIVNGDRKSLGCISSKYIYTRNKAISKVPDAADCKADVERMVQIVDMFDWEQPLFRDLFLGWLFLCMVCGGLEWRPHIWLIGSPGSGKSTLWSFAKAVTSAFNYAPQSTGNTSAAGIRQSISTDAIPVIIDEAEADRSNKLLEIIQMIRAASSETGAPMTKGGSNHKPVTFYLRNMFMLSSVAQSLVEKQDLERFIILTLKKPEGLDAITPERLERYGLIKKLMLDIDDEFSARIFYKAIKSLPDIVKNITVFEKCLISKTKDQREAKMYGTLLAGTYNFLYGESANEESAMKYIGKFGWGEMEETRVEISQGLDTTVEKSMLEHLLTSVIRVEDDGRMVDKSIMECLNASSVVSVHKNELGRLGLDWNPVRRELFIASRNQHLEKIFRGTAAANNWNDLFKRLHYAEKKTTSKRVLGTVYKGRIVIVSDRDPVIEAEKEGDDW